MMKIFISSHSSRSAKRRERGAAAALRGAALFTDTTVRDPFYGGLSWSETAISMENSRSGCRRSYGLFITHAAEGSWQLLSADGLA